jgi:excisionase family DNA binding protein
MKLLTRREAATFLRISVPTLDRHLATGLLIPTRVGRKVLFREKALEKFLLNAEAKARRRAAQRKQRETQVGML